MVLLVSAVALLGTAVATAGDVEKTVAFELDHWYDLGAEPD